MGDVLFQAFALPFQAHAYPLNEVHISTNMNRCKKIVVTVRHKIELVPA